VKPAFARASAEVRPAMPVSQVQYVIFGKGLLEEIRGRQEWRGR
jgi:hypothetical protein